MPPQNKSNFDKKTKITSSINISKIYINNKARVCLKGTIGVLEKRLRSTQFDQMEKKLQLLQKIYSCRFCSNLVAIEHKHQKN